MPLLVTEAGFDQDGRAANEQEALWTRLFADWLEEQADLVLRELERRPSNGAGPSDRRAHAADSTARGR